MEDDALEGGVCIELRLGGDGGITSPGGISCLYLSGLLGVVVLHEEGTPGDPEISEGIATVRASGTSENSSVVRDFLIEESV